MTVTLWFEPFAAPPITPAWDGRFLRIEQVIAKDGPDHEIKEQSSSSPMGAAYVG